jgi:hypothetical protein
MLEEFDTSDPVAPGLDDDYFVANADDSNALTGPRQRMLRDRV